MFHHYRRLIELRHTEPAVAHGDFTMLLPDDEPVYAFTRRLGDRDCWCWATSAANRRGSTPSPCPPGGRTRSCCSATTATPGEPGTLRAWEATVHLRTG